MTRSHTHLQISRVQDLTLPLCLLTTTLNLLMLGLCQIFSDPGYQGLISRVGHVSSVWPSSPCNLLCLSPLTASRAQVVIVTASGKHYVTSCGVQFVDLKNIAFQSWHCSTNILYNKAKGHCKGERQFTVTRGTSVFPLIKLLTSETISTTRGKAFKSG